MSAEHTFAEAVEFLEVGNFIDYDVRIDNHRGALMTRKAWLECVESGGFIDYDGMGNEVGIDGRILPNGNYADWIRPSQAASLLKETAYILWYNR